MKGFKTALIGFGMVSHGYSNDKLMRKYFKYATHAQVLSSHSGFDWQLVIDPNPEACNIAKSRWNVPHVYDSLENASKILENIEIAIIATPPQHRSTIIKSFPSLKAVLVEKPLGINYEKSESFINYCNKNNILVQVNYARRGDPFLRSLAAGGLSNMLGKIQIVYGLYGNGLRNNGTHMIDMVRMLFGEIEIYERINNISNINESPIKGDSSVGFLLKTESGTTTIFSPVDFSFYRENGLIIFGEKGRLEILNEGLVNNYYPSKANRSTTDSKEIANDHPTRLDSFSSDIFLHIYNNLLDALIANSPLLSNGSSALINEKILEDLSID